MIAMDEPTASLSADGTERLHAIIRDLAARGTAVIFVSHRLDEVVRPVPDITVFKDGRVSSASSTDTLSRAPSSCGPSSVATS